MIRWTKRSKNGSLQETVEASNMQELFQKLKNEPLHNGDYLISINDLYAIADNEWSDITELNGKKDAKQKSELIYYKIHAMTDYELKTFIRKFGGQDSYQVFEDLDALEIEKKLLIHDVTHLNGRHKDIIEDIESVNSSEDLLDISDKLRIWGESLQKIANELAGDIRLTEDQQRERDVKNLQFYSKFVPSKDLDTPEKLAAWLNDDDWE
ncbi:hypothetical protein [Weissella thailandensis]|uniref:Uncharacterized protein n=1 Tax=Weissella thailandensis TaxID=89061 RepID=A0ABX9I525_9LACO|nr:hypothetical protein [Weissella thailandensis]NKY90014.1 hypothetical protein [Weissella thailandensis]RDS59763.1 hypothetical protein DWV05_04180 [Weissella thailandensis]GEP74171.1 hypothetical protein WTH01_04180 [Weissella thailandensis]